MGPLDDHQLADTLNRHGGTFSLVEVPGEVAARLGENRVRPVYWIVQTVELSVWGLWGPGWYFDRFLLLLATLVGAAAVAFRFVPRPLAILAAALVVLGPQAESWYRLGPQESIATPLLLVGVALVLRGSRIGLALLVLAALTKESFVPIALAGTLFGWRHFPRTAGVTAAAIAGVGLLVVVVDVTRGDLYQQSRTIGQILQAAWWLASTTAIWTGWPIAVVAVVVGWRPSARWVALGLAIFVFEAYVIAGIFNGRYLLPTTLLAVALTAGALAHLVERWSRLRFAMAPVGIAVLVAIALTMTGANVWHARAVAYQASISSLLEAAAGRPIVIELRSPNDIEAVFALRHFIPEGSMMLAPVQGRAFSNALGLQLTRRTDALTQTGTDGVLQLSPWTAPADCVTALIGVLEATTCSHAVRIDGALGPVSR